MAGHSTECGDRERGDRRWRQIEGRWTRSLGMRGLRVRLFQLRKDGAFYRDAWVAGHGKDRKCLGTRDRHEAERLGKALLAALLTRPTTVSTRATLTLGELWGRYRDECPAFLDNAETSRSDDARRAMVLTAYFGADRDVRTLTANDQQAYSRARRTGGIVLPDGSVTRAVRARAVQADLVLLHSMLAWATTVHVGAVRLLDASPLAGVRRTSEKNPRRPVATWDRFVATREAIQRLITSASDDAERRQWTMLDLALVLAEATGRRLGSIRQLRWEDVDWTRGSIRWRADADKKGKEWMVPLTPGLAEELRRFQRALGALGGWVLADERAGGEPATRHNLAKWLLRAEEAASLPKLEGGVWHPYRRAWATARKHLPLKDVAAAGGWKATATLLECYQQPTEDALLEVMSEPRKVRDLRAVGGTSSSPRA